MASSPLSNSNPPTPATSSVAVNEEQGRILYLNCLRATCTRRVRERLIDWESMGITDWRERGDGELGLDVLRLFILDVIDPTKGSEPNAKTGRPGAFPQRPVEVLCRHSEEDWQQVHYVDNGPCTSIGTAEDRKSNGFVFSDFRKKLRAWLSNYRPVECAGSSQEESDSDDDDLDEDDSGYESEGEGEVESSGDSQPFPFDPDVYPTSDDPPIESKKRRTTTKARVVILTYLYVRARKGFQPFADAFAELLDSDLCLLHLCGCGLISKKATDNYGKSYRLGSCTTGDHLMLGSRDLNARHKTAHDFMVAAGAERYERWLEFCSDIPDFHNLF